MPDKKNTFQPQIKVTSGITAVHIRIFIIIISAALIINICGLAAGAVFLTRNLNSAVEEDMLVAVDIADRYVTKEIELIKLKTAETARSIGKLINAGERDGVLELVHEENPWFIGIAVFNEAALLDSWGAAVSQDIIQKPFMQIAMNGGQAVSTTMFNPDGLFVMYVSAPVSDNLVLAAVLPGLYFSNTVSQFMFWKSGHLFIDDADGYIISNYRMEWVQQRFNFLELAKTDSGYEGIAEMVKRVIAGERGTSRFKTDGTSRICAFRPVSSPNEGWFIGIIAPLGESVLRKIPGSILIMGVTTLFLSVIAAFIAAVLIKRPYDEADSLRKEAEAMSVSKSAFLANMSHEIRTPMNSIMGFAELALDGEISLKTRDYLGKIHTNADWMLQIINDILDISKVESGRMELESIPFDLHELFSSCRTLIMPKAMEKGISLYFYVEPSLGKRPLGDPTKLRQVLINLLSNAVKFTNVGMVKLNAVLKEVCGDKITMYFEVKDSGIGMTPEQIENIFDPFTQAEKATSRKYGGTGLGLPISKTIVELMGGKLAVESSPGLGSRFSFELVFDSIEYVSDEIHENKIAFDENKRPAFEGEVLLCEDNPMNQQVIIEHLTRVGLKTIVADNGKAGLDAVRNRIKLGEKQFDLIFMDIHMPVMDGLEASEKILELDSNIPIVAITANIMVNDREIYRMSGIYDCVGKPFTSQELWRCLMKYFTPLTMSNGQKNALLEAELEFQKKLQSIFVKNNKTVYSDIIKALEKGDIKLAHRIAHSLKASAGQVGKTLLQRAASSVESRLKDGKNRVTEEYLKILETELDMVLNEFSYS